MSSSKVSTIVEDGEDALGRDRVGRVGQDGAEHVGECVDALALLVLAPPIAKVEDIDQDIDQDLVGIWSIFKIKI